MGPFGILLWSESKCEDCLPAMQIRRCWSRMQAFSGELRQSAGNELVPKFGTRRLAVSRGTTARLSHIFQRAIGCLRRITQAAQDFFLVGLNDSRKFSKITPHSAHLRGHAVFCRLRARCRATGSATSLSRLVMPAVLADRNFVWKSRLRDVVVVGSFDLGAAPLHRREMV
jgi:hypothetical protein